MMSERARASVRSASRSVHGVRAVFGSFHSLPVDGNINSIVRQLSSQCRQQQPAAVRPLVPVPSEPISQQWLIPGNSSQQQPTEVQPLVPASVASYPMARQESPIPSNDIPRPSSATIAVDHPVVIKVYSPDRPNAKRVHKRFMLYLGCLTSYSSRSLKEEILEQLGKEVICFDLQFDVGYMKGAQRICFGKNDNVGAEMEKIVAKDFCHGVMQLPGRSLQL